MKRLVLMMAAAPLSSYYSLHAPEDFVQPVLEPSNGPVAVLEETPAAIVVADNTGKTDELSLAVEAEQVRNAVHIPEPVVQPCKYQLSYFMDGKAITEKHVTVEQALSSVRRLRVLGIIPATSTL